MKKLTLLFCLVASVGISQELTADTVASVDWLGEILKALTIGLVSLLGFLVKNALPLLNAYLKTIMHFRGSAVVADALTVAASEMAAEVQAAMADGKITSEEKAQLKLRAKQIAADKLKNLSGFYKKDLLGWLDDALETELAKFLSRI